MSKIGKSKTKSRWVVCLGLRKGIIVISRGYRVPFWDDENVLKWTAVMVTQAMNILKTMKLHTLNGWIIWFVNGISITLLRKNKYILDHHGENYYGENRAGRGDTEILGESSVLSDEVGKKFLYEEVASRPRWTRVRPWAQWVTGERPAGHLEEGALWHSD